MSLEWTETKSLASKELRRVPHSQGLYRLLDLAEARLLYIGETKNLRNRLTAHQRSYGEKRGVEFSYVSLRDSIRDYQPRELENDLLGGYYSSTESTPLDQFGKSPCSGKAKMALEKMARRSDCRDGLLEPSAIVKPK